MMQMSTPVKSHPKPILTSVQISTQKSALPEVRKTDSCINLYLNILSGILQCSCVARFPLILKDPKDLTAYFHYTIALFSTKDALEFKIYINGTVSIRDLVFRSLVCSDCLS